MPRDPSFGAPAPHSGGLLGVGALVFVGVVAAILWGSAHAATPAPAESEARLTNQQIAQSTVSPSPPPTAQPTLVPTVAPTPVTLTEAAKQISLVTNLIVQHKFRLAADLATLAITAPTEPLRSEDRLTLATLAYQATVADILSSPSTDLGLSDLPRYQQAEHRADVEGVPAAKRTAGLDLSVQARDVGKFDLARGVFQIAWTAETVDHHDLQALTLYYGIVRNLGWNLVESGTTATQTRGQRMLRTADEISAGYRLGRGEASDDLRQVLGPKERWPPPFADDPVLASAASG